MRARELQELVRTRAARDEACGLAAIAERRVLELQTERDELRMALRVLCLAIERALALRAGPELADAMRGARSVLQELEKGRR